MALLPSNQRDQIMVFVAVAALAAAGAYWYLAWTPKQATLAEMSTHIDSLDAQNTRAKREVARGTASKLRDQAEGYQADLEVMRKLVPTANEVPTLLEEVSTAARRVGLDIADVSPEGVIPGDRFDTYKYKIGVIGSYHRIGQLLGNVGALERIVEPINLSLAISTVGGRSPQANKMLRFTPTESKLDAKFEIRTYVVHPTTPATSTEPSPQLAGTPTGAP